MSRRRRFGRALVVVAAVVGIVAGPSLVAMAASEVDRTLSDPRITESSGLAASAVHRGVLYTHNDSDAGPEVFAVGADGATDAVLTLRGAEARDWEGMSPGKAGTDTIWVGDIGDNIDGWGTYRVYRFKEPSTLADQDVAWKQYDLRYADGDSRNAEALLVHPVTGRLYVVTKQVMGAAIYAAPTTLSETQPNVLRRVGKALPYATDAAFSPDGSLYVVRGYVDAEVYRTSAPGAAIATIDLPTQPQGESIAWSADGRFLYAGSEGRSSKVYRVPLPAAIAAEAVSADVTVPPVATPTATEPTDAGEESDPAVVGPDGADSSGNAGLPRTQVLWLGAGALVLIALGLSLRAWSKHDPDEA